MIAVQCFPQQGRRLNLRVTAWSLPATSSSMWSVRRVVVAGRVATNAADAVRLIGEALCQVADQMDAERE